MLVKGDNPNINKMTVADLQFAAMMRGDRRAMMHEPSRGKPRHKSGYTLYQAANNNDLKSVVWVKESYLMTVEDAAEMSNVTPEQLLKRLQRFYPGLTLESEIEVVDYLDPDQTMARKGLPEGFDLFIEW